MAGCRGDDGGAATAADPALPLDVTITPLVLDWVRCAQFYGAACAASARRDALAGATEGIVQSPQPEGARRHAATRVMVHIESDVVLNLAEESRADVGASLVDLCKVHVQRATKLELVYRSPSEYTLDLRAGSVDVEDLLYVQPLHAICSTKCDAAREGGRDPSAASVALSMRVYPGFSEIDVTVTDRIEWEWNPDTMLRARGLWNVRDDFELVAPSAAGAAPQPQPQPQPLLRGEKKGGASGRSPSVPEVGPEVDAGAGAAAVGIESTFTLTFTSPVDLRLNKERQNRCLAVFASEHVSVEFKIGRTGTTDMLIVFDGLVVTDAAGRVIGARARAEGDHAVPDGAHSASEVDGGGAARGTRCAISYSDDLTRYHSHVEIGALFLRYYQNTWLELVEYISYGVVSAPFIGESSTADGGEPPPTRDDASAAPNWATFSMRAPVRVSRDYRSTYMCMRESFSQHELDSLPLTYYCVHLSHLLFFFF